MSATFLYWHVRTIAAWLLSLVSVVVLASSNSAFLNPGNLFALLQSFAVLALMGVALGLVMLAGEFDLSIVGVFPLAALVAVKLSDGLGAGLATALAILVGALFGLLNGVVTAVFRIPSLAVTVGSMVLAIGVGFAMASGQIVQAVDFRPGLLLTDRIGGILSMQSIIQLVLVCVALLLVHYTWFGRNVYAVGGDNARARASGLPVVSTTILLFVICGALTAVGGSLQGITLATGQAGPNEGILLQAATAAILGGVALTGGKGNLVGVIGGAFLLTTLANGLSLMGADSATIQLVNGAILFLVVIVDRPLNRLIDRGLTASSRTTPELVPH